MRKGLYNGTVSVRLSVRLSVPSVCPVSLSRLSTAAAACGEFAAVFSWDCNQILELLGVSFNPRSPYFSRFCFSNVDFISQHSEHQTLFQCVCACRSSLIENPVVSYLLLYTADTNIGLLFYHYYVTVTYPPVLLITRLWKNLTHVIC